MALREILAKFGFELDKSKATEANSLIDSFKGKLADVGKALAIGFVFDKGAQLIGGLVSAGDQITDMSAQLGVSRQEFQAWSAAAGLGGASAEDFAASVKILEKNIGGSIAQPTSDTGKAFKKLGVDLKDSAGQVRPVLDVLRDTGINVQSLGSESEQSAALLSLFGKGGLKLGPIFKGGAKGVEELLAKMQELSLDEGTLDKLDAVGDATFLLEKQWLKTKAQLLSFALPWIESAIGGIQKFVAMLGGSEKAAHLFRSALVVLGAVVFAVGVEMLLPWLPLIALIAAAVFLVDALINALEGAGVSVSSAVESAGETVLSYTEMLGAAIQWVAEFEHEVGKAFADALSRVGAFFKGVTKWFRNPENSAVKWLKRVFDGVEGFFSAKIAAFTQFGADLINGAIAGISSAASAVIEAIKKPFTDAGDVLDTLLGRHSPSSWYRDLAFDMGLGAIDGLRAIAPKVEDAHLSTFGPSDAQLFAPQLPTGADNSRTASIQQHNQNTFHVSANAARLRDAVASGVSDASSEDNDALLAALEATV